VKGRPFMENFSILFDLLMIRTKNIGVVENVSTLKTTNV
jgi:hypothetical protein